MGTNTDWQLDCVQGVKDLGIFSLKCKVFTKSLPSELRELCRGGGRKIVRASEDETTKDTRPCRQNRTEVYVSSQRLKQHAQGLYRSKLYGGHSTESENGHRLPFLIQKLSPTDIHLQRENYFSALVLLGTEITLTTMPSSRWPTENTLKVFL